MPTVTICQHVKDDYYLSRYCTRNYYVFLRFQHPGTCARHYFPRLSRLSYIRIRALNLFLPRCDLNPSLTSYGPRELDCAFVRFGFHVLTCFGGVGVNALLHVILTGTLHVARSSTRPSSLEKFMPTPSHTISGCHSRQLAHVGFRHGPEYPISFFRFPLRFRVTPP